MSSTGSLGRAGLLAAVAACVFVSLGCTKGEGKKCNHDTACAYGLACVFTDISIIDCCALDNSGTLNCDPNDFAVSNRGIAEDCELDASGLLKPKLRRASCLGAVYEDYVLYTGGIAVNEDGNPIGPEFEPIGNRETLTNDCTCEAGANFFPMPDQVYDPILALRPTGFACERPPEDNVSVELPVREDTNMDGIITYLDCPEPGASDTCPPCVAFP